MIKLLILLFHLFLISISLADPKDDDKINLTDRIQSAEKIGYKKAPDPGDLASVGSTIKLSETDEAWAIIQAEIWGQSCRVNLRWWESNDSVNRILILIIRLEITEKELRGEYIRRMEQYASRFQEPERTKRLREIDLVKNYIVDDEVLKVISNLEIVE